LTLPLCGSASLRPLSMPGVGPDRASGIWNDAVFRGSVCAADYPEAVRYRIVAAEAGFGFRE
jgi:hypothetical protein